MNPNLYFNAVKYFLGIKMETKKKKKVKLQLKWLYFYAEKYRIGIKNEEMKKKEETMLNQDVGVTSETHALHRRMDIGLHRASPPLRQSVCIATGVSAPTSAIQAQWPGSAPVNILYKCHAMTWPPCSHQNHSLARSLWSFSIRLQFPRFCLLFSAAPLFYSQVPAFRWSQLHSPGFISAGLVHVCVIWAPLRYCTCNRLCKWLSCMHFGFCSAG